MDSQQVADALRTRAHLAAADGKLGTAQDCFTAANTIERLTKERDKIIEASTVWQDAAKAAHDEIDRQNKLISELEIENMKRKDIGYERDSLKAEIKTAREASDRVIEHLNGRVGELQGQIELWKDMTVKESRDAARQERDALKSEVRR